MEERVIEWYQYGETVINFLGISFTVFMCILILILKREYKIIPFIMIGCFLTSMQRFVIFTMDFPMLRIAILMGLSIELFNNNYTLKINKVDKVIILYALSTLICNTILIGTASAIVTNIGSSIDTLGAYFLVRFLIKDLNDIDIIYKTIVIASIIVAIFMLNEKLTGRNLFYIFGGVREFTMIREDRLRAQAAFSHPILAGTFGALIFPYAWSFWKRNKKTYAIIGMLTSIVITFSSASSGPAVALMSTFGGLFFWRYRDFMNKIQKVAIFSLIALHFVMEAPVWHLIARIDISGGSTGYHRYILIDNAIRRFSEWFLFGIRSTAHWGWGLQDVTNMYLLQGFNGGFLSMLLFIYIIFLCFKNVGLSIKTLEKSISSQTIIWALGVTLFAHVVSFIGVSYFGHLMFFYYCLLATIASLTNLPLPENTSK